MFIKVGSNEYELSTKLGTAKAIEQRFKVPIIQLFNRLQDATVDDLVAIVEIAGKQTGDKTFREALVEHYDYLDLYLVVSEIVAHLMFSGSPEENEAKLARYPGTEDQKNAIRGLLGMPILSAPDSSTGANL